jgi:HEAT repeat protein
MKKKTLILWAAVPVITLGILLLIPSSRYLVLGLVKQEPFQYGRPMSRWINDLEHGDDDARHQAAKALGAIGPEAKDAVPALSVALRDENDLVRLNASLALLKIAPESQAAIPALAEALHDQIPLIRMNAAMALNRMGGQSRAAVPALISALKDRDNWRRQPVFKISVAKVALSTLGRIGPYARNARELLAELLYDQRSSEEMRQEIADALKKIDQDEP